MPFIKLADCASPCAFPHEIPELWQKLALSTGQADPVCCAPSWNLAFHSVFYPHHRIFYLHGMESLLLFREEHDPVNGPFLVPLDDSWLFGQPLLGFYAPELLGEALELLTRAYNGHLPTLVLSGVRLHRAETVKIYAGYSRIYNFRRYNINEQCSASLTGGVDGWLSRRSANHRAKLRKASRKAKDLGVYFERFKPRTIGEALDLYERMLNIERKSWKGVGRCGMAESPSREFYAALIKRYAELGMAHIIFAVRDGRDLGFIFGGAAGGIYRGQQFSYIEEAARFSIGNLLQLEKILWLCELGFLRYDMGPITGPRMEYKRHWTEKIHEAQTWVLHRK